LKPNKEQIMLGIIQALLRATLIVVTFGLATGVASARDHFHGAPGPLLGAGIPALLLIGGGYWAVRRFRRKTD
jgi:hypothetical protein